MKKVNTNKNNLHDKLDELVDEKPTLWKHMPEFKKIKTKKRKK
jgi:hypothetical protein